MPAAEYHLTIEQGATFSIPLTFMVPSSSANPVLIPMDLTGFTASSELRDAYDNPNTLVSFTITFPPSGSATGSIDSSGSLTMSLTANQTALLPVTNTAVYDLILIQGTTIIRVLEGTVWIKPSVTR